MTDNPPVAAARPLPRPLAGPLPAGLPGCMFEGEVEGEGEAEMMRVKVGQVWGHVEAKVLACGGLAASEAAVTSFGL